VKIRKGFVSNSSSASFILTVSSPMSEVLEHFYSILNNSYITHKPIFFDNCEKLLDRYRRTLAYNEIHIKDCADGNCSHSSCFMKKDQKTCTEESCYGNKKSLEKDLKKDKERIEMINLLFVKNHYGVFKCEELDLDEDEDEGLFLFVLKELEGIKISEVNGKTEIYCFVPMLNSYVGDMPISIQEYLNHLRYECNIDFDFKVQKD